MVRVKLAQLRIIWQGQQLLTETPKNLKVLDVTVNAARFVSILRRRDFEDVDGNKYGISKGVINC